VLGCVRWFYLPEMSGLMFRWNSNL